MNLPFYIARRYLFGGRKRNAIHIISAISVAVVTVLTAALFTVLSVFNGFESLITALFNSFDPDLKITRKEGKTFDPSDIPAGELKKIPGVAWYTEVVEENALLKYGDRQYIATIKGVGNDFLEMTGLQDMIVEGRLTLQEDGSRYALLGYGVSSALGVKTDHTAQALKVYVPKKGKSSAALTPGNAFNIDRLYPGGVFSVQQEFDSKYVIVPLDFARSVTQNATDVTAIEMGLSPQTDAGAVQEEVKRLLGEGYEVKNRYEQHELLYKIMKSEKWAIFLILSFTLIIGAFNLVGAVGMIIVEKKNDICTLANLGADGRLLRRIFLASGMLITATGATAGLALGVLLCWLQYEFGIIALEGSGSFVIDAYPVEIHGRDLLSVLATVHVIGFFASWYPSAGVAAHRAE